MVCYQGNAQCDLPGNVWIDPSAQGILQLILSDCFNFWLCFISAGSGSEDILDT